MLYTKINVGTLQALIPIQLSYYTMKSSSRAGGQLRPNQIISVLAVSALD